MGGDAITSVDILLGSSSFVVVAFGGSAIGIVFGAIAGGLFVMLGPTFGAVFLLALQEGLRVVVGNQIHGLDLLIYGALLVFFIIKMPKGILGTWLERKH